MNKYLEEAIEKDKDWYRKNIWTAKFWTLNILTLGTFGLIKAAENARRVGLI